MKCFDYEAVVVDASVYCTKCAPKTYKDSAGKIHKYMEEEISPIFADSEWDCYPVCNACGYEHTYISLTADGVVNRLEMLRAKWRRLYNEYLGPIEDEMRPLARDRKTDMERDRDTIEEERNSALANARHLADLLEKRAGGRPKDLTSEEYEAIRAMV